MNYFAAGHTVKILGDGQQLIRVRKKEEKSPYQMIFWATLQNSKVFQKKK